MRTQLEDRIGLPLDEALHALGEPDRLADVSPPVFGAELRTLDEAAGDGGEQRQADRPRPDARQRGEQFVADRVHLGTVEGVRDLQEPTEHASRIERAARPPPAARARPRA